MTDSYHSPEDVQRILEERARQLARPLAEETNGEAIEVVELALGQERYGLPVQAAAEVLPLSAITPLPGAPAYWLGLINLRSQLLPVLDLAAFLGLPPASGAALPAPLEGQIVVIRGSDGPLGLLVTQVLGMQRLLLSEIGPTLSAPGAPAGRLSEGLTAGLMTILDVGKLLSDPRLVVREETV